MADLKEKLRIDEENLKEINRFLLQKDNPLVDGVLQIVEGYGGVNEINRKAREARRIENLLGRLERKRSPFVKDLQWLMKRRDEEAFISIPEYRRKILGKKAESMKFDESFAVTLEISAFNFFPWIVEEAKRAIARKDLMPARYVRVRSMKEQVEDDDIIAFAAAMQVVGSSYVQTLDTKGTMAGPDGKPINVHLGGADNDHRVFWRSRCSE